MSLLTSSLESLLSAVSLKYLKNNIYSFHFILEISFIQLTSFRWGKQFPVVLDTASFEGIPPCVGAPASLFRLVLSEVYCFERKTK